MAELITVILAEQLSYEGLFNMGEVFRIMDKWFRLKGYDKKVDFDEEYNTPTGKYIHIKLQNYKKIDMYFRKILRIWIYVHNMVEVEHEVEGQKVVLNRGKLNLTIDGFLQSDYFGKFEERPIYFFLRTLIEKYITYKSISKNEEVVRNDANSLRQEITSYLNLNKFLY